LPLPAHLEEVDARRVGVGVSADRRQPLAFVLVLGAIDVIGAK
jgi:hypothetical protein